MRIHRELAWSLKLVGQLILRKIIKIKIVATIVKLKMHQIRFRLAPEPAGELTALGREGRSW